MKLTILVCIVLLVAVSALSAETPPEPRQAACSKRSELGYCPRIKFPVCGTNGQTYDNECLLCYDNKLKNENIMIKNNGPCQQ